MERIAQVEKKIISDENNDPDAAERILWPSQYLMKNYSPLTMDQDSSSKGKFKIIFLEREVGKLVSSTSTKIFAPLRHQLAHTWLN